MCLSSQAMTEAEIRRIKVPGQPGQKKVCKTPSQWGEKVGRGGVHLPGRLTVQASVAKTSDPVSKIITAKRAQVVQHLPGKHRALSSNPSTTANNKRVCLGWLGGATRIYLHKHWV
jgi:hypothetical protein